MIEHPFPFIGKEWLIGQGRSFLEFYCNKCYSYLKFEQAIVIYIVNRYICDTIWCGKQWTKVRCTLYNFKHNEMKGGVMNTKIIQGAKCLDLGHIKAILLTSLTMIKIWPE